MTLHRDHDLSKQPAPNTLSSQSSCCLPARKRPGIQTATTQPTHQAVRELQTSSEIVDVPGGIALVGTNEPILPVDGEGPLRKKRVKPFRIDACTVTNTRFQTFVSETGYITDAERIGDSFVFAGLLPPEHPDGPRVAEAPWWQAVPGACWRAPIGPGSEDTWHSDHPVVHVSWNDACAFAEWAGGRLPTETEWEHAARGGLGDTRFPWGDREPDDEAFFPCNIWQGTFPEKNLERDGYFATAPAKSFEPNGYGLYNVVGNVWEWTAQSFKVKSLKKAVAKTQAGKKGYKLTKGGSFLCHASYCYRYRIAARTATSPDSSTSHQGFRLVYDHDRQPMPS